MFLSCPSGSTELACRIASKFVDSHLHHEYLIREGLSLLLIAWHDDNGHLVLADLLASPSSMGIRHFLGVAVFPAK